MADRAWSGVVCGCTGPIIGAELSALAVIADVADAATGGVIGPVEVVVGPCVGAAVVVGAAIFSLKAAPCSLDALFCVTGAGFCAGVASVSADPLALFGAACIGIDDSGVAQLKFGAPTGAAMVGAPCWTSPCGVADEGDAIDCANTDAVCSGVVGAATRTG